MYWKLFIYVQYSIVLYHSFLDQAEEAIETIELEEYPKAPVGEICLLSSPSIVIAFEMEVGRETIPLLVMEASLSGQVKDWSSDVSVVFFVHLYSW